MENDFNDATREELEEYMEENGLDIPGIGDLDDTELREAIEERISDNKANSSLLDQVYDNVLKIHGQICLNIYDLGWEFCKAKAVLPHGKFMSWFESKDFPFGYTTAYNCMRVYMTFIDKPEAVTHLKKDILYQLSAKNFPEELRKVIVDSSEMVGDISGDKLKKLRDDFVSGEISTESKEVQELFHYGSYTEMKFQMEVKKDFAQLEKIKKAMDEVIKRYTTRCEQHSKFIPNDKDKIANLLEAVLEIISNFPG